MKPWPSQEQVVPFRQKQNLIVEVCLYKRCCCFKAIAQKHYVPFTAGSAQTLVLLQHWYCDTVGSIIVMFRCSVPMCMAAPVHVNGGGGPPAAWFSCKGSPKGLAELRCQVETQA